MTSSSRNPWRCIWLSISYFIIHWMIIVSYSLLIIAPSLTAAMLLKQCFIDSEHDRRVELYKINNASNEVWWVARSTRLIHFPLRCVRRKVIMKVGSVCLDTFCWYILSHGIHRWIQGGWGAHASPYLQKSLKLAVNFLMLSARRPLFPPILDPPRCIYTVISHLYETGAILSSWILKGHSHSAIRATLHSPFNLTVVESAPRREGVQLKEQPLADSIHRVSHCLPYKHIQSSEILSCIVKSAPGLKGVQLMEQPLAYIWEKSG
jgi:hypothetical protein